MSRILKEKLKLFKLQVLKLPFIPKTKYMSWSDYTTKEINPHDLDLRFIKPVECELY